AELSVVVSRDTDGHTTAYPPVRNVHDAGILVESVAPAPVEAAVAGAATEIGLRLATARGLAGTLTVELFLLADGSLVVNELAPRVHNSGHWTIEGAVTSQFEQHIRAICGLPLGSRELTGASVTMDNLIGNEVDRWPDLLAEPGAHVHIYGKGEARPGRKMGHVTRVSG
ncbi:MAG: ATP-grasp domain-containing protein, partial [Sphingomicrobium sp.]